ncbi:MAG: hypothetical protein JKY52_17810 [Flavobacteriales bacterium]|nr:hypothetical protein [Flavobacteriales bacterium]
MLPQNSYSDEIDLLKVLKELLGQRKLIITGVVLCTIAAVIISLLLPGSSKKTGFFQFEPVSVSSYKSYRGVFEDVSKLNAYIQKYHDDTTWTVNSSVFTGSFEPEYAYGKYPNDLIKENTVLGVRITSTATNPQEAHNRVKTLGSYLETCVVNMEIWKHYGAMRTRLKSQFTASKVSMIEHQISMDYLKKKIDSSKGNVLSNNAVSSHERKVVKLDRVYEDYLSTHHQLIATNMSINNIEVAMELLRRKVAVDELLLGYVKSTEGLLKDKDKFLIDRSLLENFVAQFDDYFGSKSGSENLETSRYQVEATLLGFEVLRNEQFKFVSGPSLAEEPRKTGKLSIVLVVFFTSLVAFITYCLFISWWKDMRLERA